MYVHIALKDHLDRLNVRKFYHQKSLNFKMWAVSFYIIFASLFLAVCLKVNVAWAHTCTYIHEWLPAECLG